MKRNKDIPEREKARSHGYCCPHRQWGSQTSGNNWQVYYPLVFNSAVYGVWINDYAAKNSNLQYAGVDESESTLNGFKMYTSTSNNMGIAFLAIGR